MDARQDVFENFEVPDPVRIKKAAGLVRAHLPMIQGINLLECGITKGGLADILKKEGARCFGVDINPRQLEGVKTVEADLNEGYPDFDGMKFDVIFAGEVMEHLFDDVKFVRESKNLLKPGGLFIITVPNLVFSANRLLMLFGKTPLFSYAPFHYHIYTKKTLRELLKREEFEILALISSHTLFSTRINKIGRIFEILGDWLPSFGAHLIVCAKNPDFNENASF